MKTTFGLVEGTGGMIPVVGTYIGAAAKAGVTIIDIIQVNESMVSDPRTSDLGRLEN